MTGTHTGRAVFVQHLHTGLWVSGRWQPDAAQPGHAEEPLLRPARWPEGAPARATGTADTAACVDPHERPNYRKPWYRCNRPRQQQHANAEGSERPACGRSHRTAGRRATGGGLGWCCRTVGGPSRLQQLLWWLLKGQTGREILAYQLHGKWLPDASMQDLLPGTWACKSMKNVTVIGSCKLAFVKCSHQLLSHTFQGLNIWRMLLLIRLNSEE